MEVVTFQPIKIQQDFSEKYPSLALFKKVVFVVFFLQAELKIPFFPLLMEISLQLVLFHTGDFSCQMDTLPLCL